jgi:acyl-CoA synthetase (AMP-forming)/AMP-acid ligase II
MESTIAKIDVGDSDWMRVGFTKAYMQSANSCDALSKVVSTKLEPRPDQVECQNTVISKGMCKGATLIQLLSNRAQQQPQQTAYSFLQDGEVETASLSYGELDSQARMVASLLRSESATGGRALLLYPSGPEFIIAFFGCLYAGIVAVPAHPPRPNQDLSRLQAIVSDAQATFALTTSSVLAKLERLLGENQGLAALRWWKTDELASHQAMSWREADVSSDTIAYLQYTSGSTGTPKGVMVSHGNLLHNAEVIERAFSVTCEAILVGWLPFFHDMGLCVNVLQPLYSGVRCILMPPLSFVQKPLRWLQAISRYKATSTGGPNFAYDLASRKAKPEQLAKLDLSSWAVAFIGSETVRADTLDRFAATFEPCGFRREAFCPCYGLAESTLMVSGGLKNGPPVLYQVDGAALEENRVVSAANVHGNVRTIVGCGQTRLEQKIVIVEPESLTRCPDGQVGEIWVSGLSVGQGYWNRPVETDRTFKAYLADTGEGWFLRTGDLGFLKDDELFVTGRLKDVMIIRGHNHYPGDIELTVEKSHPALRSGCGAAFTVDIEGQEQVVVVQEVEREFLGKLPVDIVIGDIREALAGQHGLYVNVVLLVKPGTIPKTSSGKIQRYLCRAKFINRTLDVAETTVATLKVSGYRCGPAELLGCEIRTRKVEPMNIVEEEWQP